MPMNQAGSRVTMGMIKKLLMGLLLLLGAVNAKAQREDFQLWLASSVSGSTAIKLDWDVEVQQRFRNNASMYDQFQVEPGLAYSPFSFLKIGVGYRYIYRLSSKQQYEVKQRMRVDVRLKQNVDRFSFRYRTRLQYGFEDFSTEEWLGSNALIQRHLLSLRYDIFGSRFSPEIGWEFYHHLNKPGGAMFTKNRFVVATAFRLSYRSELEAYYIINKEVNLPDPTTEYVAGLSYKYKF